MFSQFLRRHQTQAVDPSGQKRFGRAVLLEDVRQVEVGSVRGDEQVELALEQEGESNGRTVAFRPLSGFIERHGRPFRSGGVRRRLSGKDPDRAGVLGGFPVAPVVAEERRFFRFEHGASLNDALGFDFEEFYDALTALDADAKSTFQGFQLAGEEPATRCSSVTMMGSSVVLGSQEGDAVAVVNHPHLVGDDDAEFPVTVVLGVRRVEQCETLSDERLALLDVGMLLE